MLRQARRRAEGLGIAAKCRFRKGDFLEEEMGEGAFDGMIAGFVVSHLEPREEEDSDAFLAGGRESGAVQAVPERTRFRMLEGEDAAAWFVKGLGNRSWTYLGWGQVVIE